MNKFFQIIFSKTYFSSPLKKLNKQTKKNKGFTKNRIIRFHAFFQNFQFWNLFSKSFNDRKDHLFTEIKMKGPNRKKNIIKNPILNLKKKLRKDFKTVAVRDFISIFSRLDSTYPSFSLYLILSWAFVLSNMTSSSSI